MPEFRRTRRQAPPEPKVSSVDAVLCSDLHIRADAPVCRTDDFQAAMWKKLRFIFGLCKKHHAPLLCGGDIGNKHQWPNWLLSRFIDEAKGVQIFSCLGQHDLPGHSVDEVEASGCGVLEKAGVVDFLNGYCRGIKGGHVAALHWGQESIFSGIEILLTHRMVIQGKNDYPGQTGDTGEKLLRENPDYKLILTGDNHRPFVTRVNERILVNPGSMMRATAIQADHHPRVYLWDSGLNEVEPVFLPTEPGVVDRNHIEEKQDRDGRIEALVERVKVDYEAGFSFEQNLEEYFIKNEVAEGVVQKVWVAVKGE